MISLLLSIFSSTCILIIFKIIEKQKLHVFPPIVINYIVATIFGLSISTNSIGGIVSDTPNWIYLSLIIGVLLIINFYFIGSSTRTAGIAVTTVSAKMSFVLPVIYSIAYDTNDAFTIGKLIQILLACVAVFLVVYPKEKVNLKEKAVIYPILLFFGLGILDTLIKYCQHHFIKGPELTSIFSAMNFMVAGVIGIVIILSNRKILKQLANIKVWVIGALLGLANYGSMYFLIDALNVLKINNSLVFGINNIGIVGVSVLIAFIVFKERFSKINWVGLIISIIVLILMIRNF